MNKLASGKSPSTEVLAGHTNPVKRFFRWLFATPGPQMVIKSAEGRTVTVSDEEYKKGRDRLLRLGMRNVRNRR